MILDDAARDQGLESSEEVDTLRDRYGELIDELRVILPGVQVLFAFLITAPFSSRFADLTAAQRNVYAVALVLNTLALIVLLTPVAYHRLSEPNDRQERITIAVRLKMAGLALLGGSMVAALAAVTSFVFSATVGLATAVAVATLAACFWLVFPLVRRLTRDDAPSRPRV